MSVRNTVIGFMMFVSVVAIVAIGYGSYRILVPATLENVRHDDPWKNTPPEPQHTDHSDLIQGVFTDGPSVTRECLRCHGNAAREVMKTVHWKWKGDPVHIPGKPNLPPVEIGKKNLINNFCIGIEPNLGGCTICHAGYGWFDDNFNFKDESLVDCLVCHDNTGTYGKSDGGLPTPGVDLTAVAKGVGPSKRANCGWCHFNGGGGDAVKHGDLDQTLINPAQRIDMHMGKQGFECITCHRTEHHLIKGRAMSVSVDHKNSISCTDCHNEKPHASERLNAHTFSVACQTCHIPEFAVGEPTKVDWDWSQAGQDLPITDHHVYMKIKGRFIYKKDVVPTYRWHNGMAKRYLAGDKIDPNGITKINEPLGSIHDPNSKITPFKVHRAKQPYDKKNNILLIPHTWSRDRKTGYWNEFNWDKALKQGSEDVGLPFSGSYGFCKTEMFWRINHMVATKDKALQCIDCHSPGGRMDWEALGYDGDPALSGIGGRRQAGLLTGEEAEQ